MHDKSGSTKKTRPVCAPSDFTYDAEAETHTMRMPQRLDTPEGCEQHEQRFATVEPVFANVRYNKRLDRFTLRGRTKVNGQWLLFWLVHHIEKLTHAGYAE